MTASPIDLELKGAPDVDRTKKAKISCPFSFLHIWMGSPARDPLVAQPAIRRQAAVAAIKLFGNIVLISKGGASDMDLTIDNASYH
jgi:hypothetical protein